ncbi:MAG TPA: efflux RND transporter periplasmic adaptor subunit [Stellaceae bacterium]
MIEVKWPARMLGLCAATLLGAGVDGTALAQPPASPSALLPGGAAPQEIRAQLTPRDYTTLASENAGRIDRIATRAGEHFKKGDVLIVFDCVAQRAQAAKARAVLFAAEKTYAVNRRLADLKSIGQLELDVSQAEIEKAKADVAIGDAAVSKCSITAPFSGVTIEQKAREFQYTTPGQPLLDVLDDRNLEVEFIAPSRWLPWLRPSYAFAIRVDETGKNYPAHITALGARVDPVSQSIKVTGAFDNAYPELISGMSGRIEIAPPSE